MKRAGLVWWDLTAEKRCLGYGKRMYHAELLNVPAREDAQAWCMKTSIDIHGITYDHPELCTRELVVGFHVRSLIARAHLFVLNQDGAVKTIGHWTVSSNEPTCKTWWGNHQKKVSIYLSLLIFACTHYLKTGLLWLSQTGTLTGSRCIACSSLH